MPLSNVPEEYMPGFNLERYGIGDSTWRGPDGKGHYVLDWTYPKQGEPKAWTLRTNPLWADDIIEGPWGSRGEAIQAIESMGYTRR